MLRACGDVAISTRADDDVAVTAMLRALMRDVRAHLRRRLCSACDADGTAAPRAHAHTRKRARDADTTTTTCVCTADKDDDSTPRAVRGVRVRVRERAPLLLDALTDEDWSYVLHPCGSLRACVHQTTDNHTTTSCNKDNNDNNTNNNNNNNNEDDGSSDGARLHRRADDVMMVRDTAAVVRAYVRARCAELPMRLQGEAVLLRRHEHLLRQYTRELVTLSEYVALCSTPGTRRRDNNNNSHHLGVTVDDDDDDDDTHVRRRAHGDARIGELERAIQHHALCKVRCCQRMVLLAEVARALVTSVHAD